MFFKRWTGVGGRASQGFAFIKRKHHNHQDHPISEKVPRSIPRRSLLAVLCLLLLAVWFLLLLAVAVVAVVPVVAVVALVVAVPALVALAAAFGGASRAAAIKWYGCRRISACWDLCGAGGGRAAHLHTRTSRRH